MILSSLLPLFSALTFHSSKASQTFKAQLHEKGKQILELQAKVVALEARKNKSSAQVADSEPLPLDIGAGLGCVKEGSDEDGSDDENNVPDDNGSGYELLEQLKNDLFDGVVNALKDAMSATTESFNALLCMRKESEQRARKYHEEQLTQQQNEYEALMIHQQKSDERLNGTMLTTIESAYKTLNLPGDNGSGYELLEQLKNDLFDGVVNALKDAMSATTESFNALLCMRKESEQRARKYHEEQLTQQQNEYEALMIHQQKSRLTLLKR